MYIYIYIVLYIYYVIYCNIYMLYIIIYIINAKWSGLEEYIYITFIPIYSFFTF